MTATDRRSAPPRDCPPVHSRNVALILAGAKLDIPGYWNLELDVRVPATRISREGSIQTRQTLWSVVQQAFESHREILTEGNYSISLSSDPATVDFLEIMRAKLLVSKGEEPIEIIVAEEQEVVEEEPARGVPPRVAERRVAHGLLDRPDEPLPEGMVVFDLSDDGGSGADGSQIPIEIPGARVVGWRGLRNRSQLVHEAYAEAAVHSLIARAARLGARRSDQWGIYVGRKAQPAVAVLRGSRGFYAGRMIPILVREQWRRDVPGAPPSW
ncbi:MAG: hypothetical protein QNK03_06080 [Myxococcota bacterium]|nr:hypothetical protein [Myxococcota bacterium]